MLGLFGKVHGRLCSRLIASSCPEVTGLSCVQVVVQVGPGMIGWMRSDARGCVCPEVTGLVRLAVTTVD